MIEQVRARVAEKLLAELDGVVAMRTNDGRNSALSVPSREMTSPNWNWPRAIRWRRSSRSSTSGTQRRRLAWWPARATSARWSKWPSASRSIPQRLHIVAVACTAEEVEDCYCSDPVPRHRKTGPRRRLIGDAGGRRAAKPDGRRIREHVAGKSAGPSGSGSLPSASSAMAAATSAPSAFARNAPWRIPCG